MPVAMHRLFLVLGLVPVPLTAQSPSGRLNMTERQVPEDQDESGNRADRTELAEGKADLPVGIVRGRSADTP